MKLIPIIVCISLLFAVGCKTTDGKSHGTFEPSRIMETGEFTSELGEEASEGVRIDLGADKVSGMDLKTQGDNSNSPNKRPTVKVSKTIIFRATPGATGSTELTYTEPVTAAQVRVEQAGRPESLGERTLKYGIVWIVVLLVAFGLFKIWRAFPIPKSPYPDVFRPTPIVSADLNRVEKDGISHAALTSVYPETNAAGQRMREF